MRCNKTPSVGRTNYGSTVSEGVVSLNTSRESIDLTPLEFETIEEKITRLKQRGMEFGDEGFAARVLEAMGTWRLRPYWHLFELSSDGVPPRSFKPGTTFEDVYSLYEFDRELRLLVFSAIERVEVAIRAAWARAMYKNFGPLGYAENVLYKGDVAHCSRVIRLAEEWRKETKTNLVASKFDKRYGPFTVPPIDRAVEIMTFGELNKWMDALDTGNAGSGGHEMASEIRAVASEISARVGLPYRYLVPASRYLGHVRNLAAHHSRLWDKVITCCYPGRPKKGDRGLRESTKVEETMPQSRESIERYRQRIYLTLTLLAYLGDRSSVGCGFRDQIVELIKQYKPPLWRMGFPPDWRQRPVWVD